MNKKSDPLKLRVLARDNFRCQCCSNTANEMPLHIHHKDANRSHNTLKNLITLCRRCHFLIHELASHGVDCENVDVLLKDGKVPIGLRRLILAKDTK